MRAPRPAACRCSGSARRRPRTMHVESRRAHQPISDAVVWRFGFAVAVTPDQASGRLAGLSGVGKRNEQCVAPPHVRLRPADEAKTRPSAISLSVAIGRCSGVTAAAHCRRAIGRARLIALLVSSSATKHRRELTDIDEARHLPPGRPTQAHRPAGRCICSRRCGGSADG